jgi:hypothetical protein
MGLSHSPSIVTSNLILALDAANPKSYSGSGNTWFDITGRGNHGTLVNGPAYSSNSGGFISCDGTNDYIEILDNSIFDFGSNNFSVEYWFRKNATTTGYQHIWGVNKWNSGGGGAGTNEWSLGIGNGSSGTGESIIFGLESGSIEYNISISNTPKLYLWNQLVAIRAGAGLSVYMNGALIGTSSPVGMAVTTPVNNISGRNIRISNSALNNYYSKSDSSIVRIYNKALTPDEVKQNYDATKGRYTDFVPIVTDGLIANYDPANIISYPGTGTLLVDLSGNNKNATLTNGPVYAGSGATGHILLDGTNDFILSLDVSSYTNLTIEFWVYDARGAYQRDFLTYNDNSGSFTATNTTYFRTDGNGIGARQFPTATMYLNQWYRICYVKNSDLWINGTKHLGSGTDAPYGTLKFGNSRSDVNSLLNGRFGPIKVYNRSLTASEIRQNFDAVRGRYGV